MTVLKKKGKAVQNESLIHYLFGFLHYQFYAAQSGTNGYLRLADDPNDHRAGDSRALQANHWKEKVKGGAI